VGAVVRKRAYNSDAGQFRLIQHSNESLDEDVQFEASPFRFAVHPPSESGAATTLGCFAGVAAFPLPGSRTVDRAPFR
jgi:hypothetical protein